MAGLPKKSNRLGTASGRVVVPRKRNIDTAGPIARNVTDAARLLTALAGPDPADPLSQRTFACFAAHMKSGNGYIDFTSRLKKRRFAGNTDRNRARLFRGRS